MFDLQLNNHFCILPVLKLYLTIGIDWFMGVIGLNELLVGKELTKGY